jgi:formylglycine-generating enzyme required for sulfatase activity
MLKTALFVGMVFCLCVMGCRDGAPPEGDDIEDGAVYTAGDLANFSAGGVDFNMVYVPGTDFFTGTADGGTASVTDGYWIGETEVTYELWHTVYDWAAANGYAFANEGTMGDGSGDTVLHPVTTVNWRDAIVWCNAATEWYNFRTDADHACVYTNGDTVIRNSRDINAAVCDGALSSAPARGFRLLTSGEWELAARYINDENGDGDIMDAGEFYPGNFASGASGDCDTNFGATQKVAVWGQISTAPVKSKTANALGLYDMSGNAGEWCFDLEAGNARVMRGGSWISVQAKDVKVGLKYTYLPEAESSFIGFRIARSR